MRMLKTSFFLGMLEKYTDYANTKLYRYLEVGHHGRTNAGLTTHGILHFLQRIINTEF